MISVPCAFLATKDPWPYFAGQVTHVTSFLPIFLVLFTRPGYGIEYLPKFDLLLLLCLR